MHQDHRNGHFATIAATATAVPPHVLTREDVKTYMRKVFDVEERRLDAMMSVIDNAQVHKRHAIRPRIRPLLPACAQPMWISSWRCRNSPNRIATQVFGRDIAQTMRASARTSVSKAIPSRPSG